MLKFICTLSLFLALKEGKGQQAESEMKPRKSQLIVHLDNDAFISGRQDRYYSSGHYLTYYQYQGNGKSLSIGFGNQIFTPDLRKELEPEEIDRPFAGLNYLEFGFQKRKSGLVTGFTLLTGLIGPKSGVGQFHNWYHDTFGFPRAKGWEHQIEDAFLLNLDIKATKSIIRSGSFEFLVDGMAAIGNLEQSLSIKPSIRLGTFEDLEFSQITGSRVGTTKRQEQYFQLGVELRQVFFNRTIDGNLIDPEIPPEFESENSVAEVFGEFILNYNHFGMGYGIYYRTKENEAASNQVFGRITLSWLF